MPVHVKGFAADLLREYLAARAAELGFPAVAIAVIHAIPDEKIEAEWPMVAAYLARWGGL